MTDNSMFKSFLVLKRLLYLAFIVFMLSLITCECEDKEAEVFQPPWMDNQYSESADSVLLQKIEQDDTLAALTLAWRYLQDTTTQNQAAQMLWEFNRNYELASDDLNYLTGKALYMVNSDSLAISYLGALEERDYYPDAGNLLANAYKNRLKYEKAVIVYEKMDKDKFDGIEDSILRCKAELGDTLSGIRFAERMLEHRNIGMAAKYYTKYVSLSRGVSPAGWSFGAGKAYYYGNNPTRAAVYLENADADTNLAELSELLGRNYYRLEVFDSAASKLSQALEMRDTTAELVYLLMQCLSGDNRPEEALGISYLGIRLFPEDERFYFMPSRFLYETENYDSLQKLSEEARKNVGSSFKIDAYYIGALCLLEDTSGIDTLLEQYIDNYKFEAGALKEASRLFGASLNREDIAARLEAADPTTTYPEMFQFLFWYQRIREEGMSDSARSLLLTWIEMDTVEERRALIEELYERDYPQSQE